MSLFWYKSQPQLHEKWSVSTGTCDSVQSSILKLNCEKLIQNTYTNKSAFTFPPPPLIERSLRIVLRNSQISHEKLRHSLSFNSSRVCFSAANYSSNCLSDFRLVYIGGILGGAAGTVFMSAPALLSNLWFPVSERFTATAIGAGSAYIGTGLAFVAGEFSRAL